MTDTTIIEVPTAADGSRTPFSWSAAIAGAFAATAVTFIITALGSGIGLPFASPYSSGLSATGLTVAAAVWHYQGRGLAGWLWSLAVIAIVYLTLSRLSGLDDAMKDAVAARFLPEPLRKEQLDELFKYYLR